MATVGWYEIITKEWIGSKATEYWYMDDDSFDNAVITLTACPFDVPPRDIYPDYRHPAFKVAVERVYLENVPTNTGRSRRLHFAVRNLSPATFKYSVYLSCVWP